MCVCVCLCVCVCVCSCVLMSLLVYVGGDVVRLEVVDDILHCVDPLLHLS